MTPARVEPPSSKPLASAPHYKCDHGIAFSVRFEDGTAVLDAGERGVETLERDAGGTTPEQTVYSSTQLKAQFGLGTDGREAQLNYAEPPLEAHCVRG